VTVLFLIWWIFFSRIPWADRFLGLVACGVVGTGMWFLYHRSIQGKDPPMIAMSLQFNTLPVVLAGWAVWMLIARSFSRQARMAGLVVVFMLTWGSFAALRLDGVTGTFAPEYSLRWKPTAKDNYLASRGPDKAWLNSVADAGDAAPVEV